MAQSQYTTGYYSSEDDDQWDESSESSDDKSDEDSWHLDKEDDQEPTHNPTRTPNQKLITDYYKVTPVVAKKWKLFYIQKKIKIKIFSDICWSGM